jgi:subtilisin family serine protease
MSFNILKNYYIIYLSEIMNNLINRYCLFKRGGFMRFSRITFLIIFLGILLVNDSSADLKKLTGRLQLEIEQKDLANRGMLSTEEFERVVLKSPVPTQFQRVFIHFDKKPDIAQIAELEAMGVKLYEESWIPPISGHPTGFMTADVPIDRVVDISNLYYVKLMNTAEFRYKPLNNIGASVISADYIWGMGYSGYGVTVAVLDSGLEYTNSSNKHADLPANVTKIDYSEWPSKDTDVRNMVTDHGTHVTGTVLGRGTLSASNTGNGGGPYKGMSYNASLVFIKIGSDLDGTASMDAIVNALKDAAQVYDADVINMSYGGWNNYNDGSEEDEQAADYAYTMGSAVFISAGNSADDDEHYSATVSGYGSSGCIQVNLTNYSGSAYFYVNLVWFDGYPTSKDLYLRFYSDPSCTTEVSKTEYTQTQSLRGTESQWYRHPSNGNVLSGSESARYIKVFNNASTSQLFHLYLESWNVDARFQNPDPDYTLGAPSTADNAMSVAAFVSRANWKDYFGNSWCYTSTGCYGTGGLAFFSSRGPRIDAMITKPNLTAPGMGVISLRDHDIVISSKYIIDSDGLNLNGSGPADYRIMSGTSMASPMAAGAAALLIESFQYLKGNPGILYSILQSTATDVEPGTYGDGYGLVNLQSAFDILIDNIYTGDFNGDGRIDILTFNPSGGAVVRLSKIDGNGNWNGWENHWAAWPSVYSKVYIGDFNGDGKDDILTVNPANGGAVLRQSTGGAGTWIGWSNKWAAWPSNYNQVYVGDFNGDGRSDILTRDPVTGGAVIRQSIVSSGNWTGWSNKWAAWPSNYNQVYVGDFNGDGRSDILTRDPVTGGAVIRQSIVSSGDWTGWSNKWAAWPSNYPKVYLGDFNGDGKDDILTANPATGAAVIRQSVVSSGDWTGWSNKWAAWPSNYNQVYVGDFNDDGRSDILTRDPVTGGAVIRQSIVSSGNWTGWSNKWAAWPSVYGLVYPADYNSSSGSADILTVNPVGGAVMRQSIVSGGSWTGFTNIWAAW